MKIITKLFALFVIFIRTETLPFNKYLLLINYSYQFIESKMIFCTILEKQQQLRLRYILFFN